LNCPFFHFKYSYTDTFSLPPYVETSRHKQQGD
jgi:hypothetical protein